MLQVQGQFLQVGRATELVAAKHQAPQIDELGAGVRGEWLSELAGHALYPFFLFLLEHLLDVALEAVAEVGVQVRLVLHV